MLGRTVEEWKSVQAAGGKAAAVERLLNLASSFSLPVWIHVATEAEIQAQIEKLPDDPNSLPLWGVPYAVKDNIDVEGMPTSAACKAYIYTAEEDAFVVARLREAGAIVLGKTNLDQFATGLVGTRSPYGFPTCVFSKDHVSGGSSSGSAVAVASGQVPFSLGTDTAGSGRVPAALNNLVGVKPTLGLWSTSGVVPACRSLDTITVFALGLRDAQTVLSLAIKYDQVNPYSRKLPERPVRTFGRRPLVGVPLDNQLEFYGEDENRALFAKSIKRVREFADVVPVDCSSLFRLAKLLYEGPWVAERLWATQKVLEENPESFDPTVRSIVEGGKVVTGVDTFDKEYRRREIQKQTEALFEQLDAIIMPTCPLNPRVDAVQAEPIKVNSQQGYYTNFVNLADLAALAVPSGFRDDGLSQGVTFISRAFSDFALLDLATRFLPDSREVGKHFTKPAADNIDDLTIPGKPITMPLVVVGAHLSGMVLNWQLRKVGATLNERSSTASSYRLWALPTSPPKPGLERVKSGGSAIDVEVWDVPVASYGDFIAMVPHPLGIGSVELANGRWLPGFICEPLVLEGAKDISSFGGWRGYMATQPGVPFSKVLIANRGEIAVRALRTLKRLGIKSVAVFSEPDRHSQHVKLADEAVDLRGVTAAETYLSISKMIAAAKQTGAVAVIPGYGFLSENADFSDACMAEGIIFCGPSGAAMRHLGLKHSARELARKAGVPLVPGTGLVETSDEALKLVPEIGGYPIMIKSTAGGGGIGLQRADSDEELKKAFSVVKHQGQAYFGDSGVFLESFVENARHVEVQVFGDGRGGAVSLGERDCSLQRRNQKIVEETPAPDVPAKVISELHRAARNLAASMSYKGAGTVEFIYDSQREAFYFLEVNARLQVEHPITEAVTGLDLIEWMLLVASDRPPFKDAQHFPTKGAAMEARLYAENPVRDFRPSPGQITGVEWPGDGARIDTWVDKGTVVSSEYDPTIAKIIVHGSDRKEALAKLLAALENTHIEGVITNIDYLRAVVSAPMFTKAKMFTKALDSFSFAPRAIEIEAPGPGTSIQDWPGRRLLWRVGVPPSGPMDDVAHRVANFIVGNSVDAPVLEATLSGPTILFHVDSIVAVTGGAAPVTVDGDEKPQWTPITVHKGQKLTVGKLKTGCRSYISIRGGLDVPSYLGSRSTFAQGALGGYNGRLIKFGDVIMLGDQAETDATEFPSHLVPSYGSDWEVGVTIGPHGAPDFFTEESIVQFFASEWKVHYNSNRFGVRLVGPKPTWARADGGEGGLHPSNAHDYVYSLGAINFTGDEPVILTCDGPSLGGFVCAAVVVEAELWKIGQVKPGDRIRFVSVSASAARELKAAVDRRILGHNVPLPITEPLDVTASPVLHMSAGTDGAPKGVYRQAGDRYILVEYGENVMDLNLRYRVHQLTEKVTATVPGVLEMSPGVRSVLVEYDPEVTSQQSLLGRLKSIEDTELPWTTRWTVPSRVIHLPMAFEDSQTLAAVQRYAETIRSDAPWLPNNVDFITEVNGLSNRGEVRSMLYEASFMVLGLGDVYLGAPCAVPLDPRHRLLGSKYNPSRSWTPNGTVGIGGMYMCIYTMESPGGYQLVGRTVPIWDKLQLNRYTVKGEPWLLRPFDQVRFYPVTEPELEKLVDEVETGEFNPRIAAETFDSGHYAEFLAENASSIKAHEKKIAEHQGQFASLISASNAKAEEASSVEVDATKYSDAAEFVYAEVTGRFWKAVAAEGDVVAKDAPVVILEAMKTEMVVPAVAAGTVVHIVHKNGDMVEAGDVVAVIEP